MSFKVGTKGQIVIDKEIRDRLGVQPGWVALQRIEGDHVVVHFVPPEHNASLKGSLAREIRTSVGVGLEWDKAREAAWAAAARRVVESSEHDE